MIDMDDHTTRCILQGYEEINANLQELKQFILEDTKRRHHYEVSGVLQTVDRLAKKSERYRADLRLSFEKISNSGGEEQPPNNIVKLKRTRQMNDG